MSALRNTTMFGMSKSPARAAAQHFFYTVYPITASAQSAAETFVFGHSLVGELWSLPLAWWESLTSPRPSSGSRICRQTRPGPVVRESRKDRKTAWVPHLGVSAVITRMGGRIGRKVCSEKGERREHSA
jgi:hypothetical protein